MKVTIVALLVCVAIAVEATVNKIPPKKIKFESDLEQCSNDPSIGIDKEALRAYTDTNAGTKPANFGKLSVCMVKELGWMKTDNTLDTAKFLQSMAESGKEEVLKKAKKIVGEADQGNVEDTADKIIDFLVDFSRPYKAAAIAAAAASD